MASRNLEPFTPLPQALGAKLRLNVGEMQSTLSMFSLLHQDATDRIPLLELVSIHHPSHRVISAIKKCTQAITRSLELYYYPILQGAPPPTRLQHSSFDPTGPRRGPL
jgi:hypothetical protein